MGEKPPRKPRATLEAGLPPDLQLRFDRATDRTVNRFAPMKSDLIRRGIELALIELEQLPVRIANELAEARGIKASFSSVHYDTDTPEGQIWADAVRIAGILRK